MSYMLNQSDITGKESKIIVTEYGRGVSVDTIDNIIGVVIVGVIAIAFLSCCGLSYFLFNN